MTVFILMIVFGTPIAIVALVLRYKLVRLRMERNQIEHTDAEPLPASDYTALLDRAEDFKRRITNLEDILKEERV
ncbi:MAG: hypothetical protein KDC35_15540 [Acidobacteria bacterium]|nr:hypothetical protein [Acidobacteriota bacterium]